MSVFFSPPLTSRLNSQLSTFNPHLSLIEIAQQEHAHGVLLCFRYGVGIIDE